MLRVPARVAAAALLLVSVPSLLMPKAAPASSRAKVKSRSCAYANSQPTSADAAVVDRATLCLIDRIRIAHHLQTLRSNHELQLVAGSQAAGMVSNDYFSDNSPSGQTPGTLIETIPYGAHAARLATAQNLGWGTLSAATPAGMVTAWMDSPPHREMILTGEVGEKGLQVCEEHGQAGAHGLGGGGAEMTGGHRPQPAGGLLHQPVAAPGESRIDAECEHAFGP